MATDISVRIPLTTCFVVAMAFHPRCVLAQDKKDATCKVEITSPRPGAKVGATEQVDGTATIKAGTFLWVFAHRKGLAIWWPQGSGPASVRKGEWSALASVGGPQDRGASFEILAGVVDAETNNKLNSWVRKSDETGTYTGITLPVFVEGCGEPSLVTVTKIN